MTNTFVIDGTTFALETERSNELTIRSHPTDYKVVFEPFENKFTNNQVVLVDKRVRELYGISHHKLIEVEAIEENKNIDTVLRVCEQLLQYEFDRGQTLIVIGGGIVQDIGAYTAKTFKRGIEWVYVPTTLLSQSDSCIGGKTALNFKNYKNQLALFSAPKKVVIDVSFLKTLSERDMISGYGEIAKLFITGGSYYINNFDAFDIETTIYHSLSIKKAIVEVDEFEIRERKSLNYGHSFGHAIESVMNYEIPHGEAVLLGIELINRLFTNSSLITDVVERFTSLKRLKRIDIDALIRALKTDKKISNGMITFVVTPSVGETVFVRSAINDDVKDRVNAILAD
jgi:3-dehydroquinate synthase